MHQYLLMTNEPVLIQTGAVSQAQTTIPKLQELLGERKIKYILISHFWIRRMWRICFWFLCTSWSCRVFVPKPQQDNWMGFGITNNVLIKKPNEIFAGDDFEFRLSVTHLKCICGRTFIFEKKRGIFFSSDLMFGMGENHGQVIESSWRSGKIKRRRYIAQSRIRTKAILGFEWDWT